MKSALVIVMGTSGCGKSTIGSAVAQQLQATFIDGDDLHPRSNVEKMASGQPLDDTDREPWLERIRQKAIEITQDSGSGQRQTTCSQATRRLAEVMETSSQSPAQSQDAQTDAKHNVVSAQSRNGVASPDKYKTCVIACSALKRKYRDKLRGDVTGVNDPTSLVVFHLYLKVAPEELLRRMHARKGHFMKEGMLKSQLLALEEPDPLKEPRTIIIDAGQRTEQVVSSAVQALEAQMYGSAHS